MKLVNNNNNEVEDLEDLLGEKMETFMCVVLLGVGVLYVTYPADFNTIIHLETRWPRFEYAC